GAVVTDPQLCNAATPAELCPDDTDLAGVWVTDADTDCDVEGVTTFTCPDDSQIPGAIVTDPLLCDLVTEDFKGCNTCVLFGVGGVDGTNAFNLIGGINDFTLNGQVGAEALCELEGDELIEEYTDIVEATVSGDANQEQSIELFTDCIDNLEANNLAGFSINSNGLSINSNGQIQQTNNTQSNEQVKTLNQNAEQNKNVETTSNAQIQQQTSNTQLNEQLKTLNQNVEQNKNVEQKKNPSLPLFKFNHQ
ncbi:MAG TPA: hypothetical protein VLA74_03780, partial [Nitrososphaeraceae archaeon]|nr:hypothetical protein [Nitrososphaeraceae archaeon]